MNDNSIITFRRGYRMQWETAQNIHVILYPEGMAKLNETAAAILALVDGTRDIKTVISELNSRYPQSGGVDNDVKEFLKTAYEHKWIRFHEPE